MGRAWRLVMAIGVAGVWLAAGSPAPVTAAVSAACLPAWGKVAAVNYGSAGNQLLAVDAVAADDVWVGGVWNASSYGPLLEHWDGSTWAVSAARGANGFIEGLAGAAPDDVWAVGTSTVPVQHWNGTAWSAFLAPVPRGTASVALHAVAAVSANDVWAVGDYVKAGTHSLTEHWNGTAWTRVPSPDSPAGGVILRGVAGRAPDDVWAVGYSLGAQQQPVVEHWNGSAWSLVPSPAYPGSENDLFGVTAVTASSAWAVGMAGDPGSWAGVIEHWDGHTWTAYQQLAEVPTGLFAIRAVSANDIWATGRTNSGPLLLHWDGRAWTRVTSPAAAPAGQGVDAISALPNGDLWAAGDQTSGGKAQTLVERACPVKVTDSGFVPQSTRTGLGLTAVWEVPPSDSSQHSVTDATGMGLFASGALSPGGSFTYKFTAAGTYTVSDGFSSFRGTMKIPLSVPASAVVGQPFTVKWAPASAAPGYVFDVQVQPPGTTTWTPWLTGTAASRASYTAAVQGSYRFRARLRKISGGASGYSPAGTITAGGA